MTTFKGMKIESPLEGFGGSVLVESTRPVFQEAGYYGQLSNAWNTFTGGTGTAGTSGRVMSVTTGTTANSYGVIQSKRSNVYRPGQAGVMKFTGVFNEGVTDSKQIIGALALGDGYFYGYNGTQFGIMHRYGGLAESRLITITGASGGSTNLTLTLNSVAYTIPLTAGTTAHNAFEIATWLEANQSVWRAFQNQSTVYIIAQSDGAKSGTYSYSHATSTGTIVQQVTGVSNNEDFIPFTANDWTGYGNVSWLNPQFGNVYVIVYPYLGFGNIKFHAEHQDSGLLVEAHQIKYTNRNIKPAVGNPSFRAGMAVYSEGSTTDIELQCASFQMGMQGERQFTRDLTAYDNIKSLTTTETNIFTIRNRFAINGYFAQAEIQPLLLSIGNDGTKTATFRVHKNATVGGEPNFANVGTNLQMSEADTAGTTITNPDDTVQISFQVLVGTSKTIDLRDLDLRLNPGERLTISAFQNTGGAAGDLSASLTWYEDY